MSDVFSGKVAQDGDTILADGYGELADFSGYKREARYAAHAINNHDSMVEEIAELKCDSLELIKAIKFLYKNTRHINELQSKNIESMIEYHEAKLNQEGEE